MFNKQKSITITNPATKRKGARPKSERQFVQEGLYSLVVSLKEAIENPEDVGYPATIMSGYGKGGVATRLIVGVWKKYSQATDDFIHGEIEIKKAKRTRIPGTNVYALGEVSKDELNIMARDYKERAKRKKAAIKRVKKS